MLPFEKKTIRIYFYYFKGFDKPLIIEANNRTIADEYLITEVEKIKQFIDKPVLEEVKVTTPVYGVTEKEEKNSVYIWAGYDNSISGWLIKDEFDKLKKK